MCLTRSLPTVRGGLQMLPAHRSPVAQVVPFLKDIIETENEIVIEADAPGLTKDDIKVRSA